MAMLATTILKFLTVIFFYTKCDGHMTITAWESDRVVSPPPIDQVARMARYVVHISDWCSIASIASDGKTKGYPKARVYSMADGSYLLSSGTPYIYTTLMDPQTKSLSENNRSSVSVSLAQSSYCKEQSYDPEDPRCAQVILTGRFSFVKGGTKEFIFAKSCLFERHPAMQSWPKTHNWQVGKLTIEEIQVLDNFGGSKYVTPEEYYKATPF